MLADLGEAAARGLNLWPRRLQARRDKHWGRRRKGKAKLRTEQSEDVEGEGAHEGVDEQGECIPQDEEPRCGQPGAASGGRIYGGDVLRQRETACEGCVEREHIANSLAKAKEE
eukprot:8910402-Pyramimonas_sp.AAC.1